MLHDAGLHFDVLGLLQDQQQNYTAELGLNHQAMSKLYKRLACIEHDLNHRHEKGLSRKEKKKLQWSKSEAKYAVGKLEFQQATLHEYLRQCSNLMDSYAGQSCTPWLPPIISPIHEPAIEPYTPFTHGLPGPWSSSGGGEHSPQYWDLSMLPERHQAPALPTDLEAAVSEHVVSTGIAGISGGKHVNANETEGPQQPLGAQGTPNSSSSAADARRALSWFKFPNAAVDATSHTEGGATPDSATTGQDSEVSSPSSSSHKRRLSEKAIQIIEARLATHTAARKQSSSQRRETVHI